MMGSIFHPALNTLIVIIIIKFVCGEIYHITPAQNASSCPLQSCIDLSKLAAIDFSSQRNSSNLNITLLFLSGNHSLDHELVLTNAMYIHVATTAGSGPVCIECIGNTGRMVFSDAAEVLIEGLIFIGCGDNLISVVDNFTIAGSIFKGVTDSGTALILSRTAALINACAFVNNTGSIGWKSHYVVGGAIILSNSTVWINGTRFERNSVELGGAIFAEKRSNISIENCLFQFQYTLTHYRWHSYGAIYASESAFHIIASNFSGNTAANGGVIYSTADGSFHIIDSSFTGNTATRHGGVIYSAVGGSFHIADSTFTDNTATSGGVIYNSAINCSFHIVNSTITNNTATSCGGVIYTAVNIFINITNSVFIGNAATGGGVTYDNYGGTLNITNSSFIHNRAKGRSYGGVIHVYSSRGVGLLQVISCNFTQNSADTGGVMYIFRSSFHIANSTFSENNASKQGIVYFVGRLYPKSPTYMYSTKFNNLCHIDSSTFNKNSALGGIVSFFYASVDLSGKMNFVNNNGSLHVFISNLTISGFIKFENCTDPYIHNVWWFGSQGGAITSVLSSVQFRGVSQLMNNKALSGGAILAFQSTISISNETIIANNQAIGDGGSVSLRYSKLVITGVGLVCNISHNSAKRGGAIHAIGSTIIVNQPSVLNIINNSAENGGGLYFEGYTKIDMRNLFKNQGLGLTFTGNQAEYGGAIFVDDKSSSSAACTTNSECFFQYWSFKEYLESSVYFSNNSATRKGSNIYGGMLNRCIQNSYAELSHFHRHPYTGLRFMELISNIASNLKSISSLPVQVCFCNDQGYQDCNYQPPTVNITTGETFTVSVVAVDQVNNSLATSISSYLSSYDGAFDEGQQIQPISNSCTNLTFNIFSSNSFETLVLYANGPCAYSEPSARFLNITFSNCTCPIGFEPSNARWQTTCECVCDSRLSPYITLCNYSISSVIRVNTNSWITFVNKTDTNISGFVIYPICPFDYCHDPNEKISINFNNLDGGGAQCAHFHKGVLCGACQQNLSLSLGSSRCLPCQTHWPVMNITILLAFIVAGILLVVVLMAVNMTVAVGLVNSFIFYSNIIAAASPAYFSSSRPSFPKVFVAWLNLDIGFDVCFIDGLDTYTKTWLQLAFPVYIISLVFLIIICSKFFSKFATFIGKRDPVSTLATLILLSYSKLLSVIIAVLSFAVLDYPDGTRTKIWLLDGNLEYCQGKHTILFIAALLIILVGVPYTALLFLWQWLVRLPNWRIFRWTRNTKLNAFISTYHTPYSDNYRYWTGLLLLVRVMLYITGAVTVSKNPQVSLLMTIISVGGLLFHKAIIRVYRKLLADIVETIMYFNILILTTFTLFKFKTDNRKQMALTYISTVITFILLIGVVVYQVVLIVRKKRVSEDTGVTQSSAIIELSTRQQAEVSLSRSRSSETPYRLMPYESNSN